MELFPAALLPRLIPVTLLQRQSSSRCRAELTAVLCAIPARPNRRRGCHLCRCGDGGAFASRAGGRCSCRTRGTGGRSCGRCFGGWWWYLDFNKPTAASRTARDILSFFDGRPSGRVWVRRARVFQWGHDVCGSLIVSVCSNCGLSELFLWFVCAFPFTTYELRRSVQGC